MAFGNNEDMHLVTVRCGGLWIVHTVSQYIGFETYTRVHALKTISYKVLSRSESNGKLLKVKLTIKSQIAKFGVIATSFRTCTVE